MKISSPSLTFLGLMVMSSASHVHSHSGHQHHQDNLSQLGQSHLRQLRNRTKTESIRIANKEYSDFNAWARSSEFKASGARCKTHDPTEEQMAESERLFKKWMDDNDCEESEEKDGEEVFSKPHCNMENKNVVPRQIKTYWHVIRKGGGVSDGNVPQSWVTNSMNVLNAAFAPHFQFNLETTTRTTNGQWYTGRSEQAMKNQLHKGSCDDLNIYSNSPSGGTLGFAYFPNECRSNLKRDGVVILDQSMPGGSSAPYNLGDTLVHEVGHWLGLWHTFQGGCSGQGDQVADTPAERDPGYGCPNRDTCPNDPGKDPVTNYMDYSDDSCMEKFSTGQINRMIQQWSRYRNNDSPQPPTPNPPTPNPPTPNTPAPSPSETSFSTTFSSTSPPTSAPTTSPPTNCPKGEAELEVIVKTDGTPFENRWELINDCARKRVLSFSLKQYAPNSQNTFKRCIPDNMSYTFKIFDSFGDGMCSGGYTIRYKGEQVGEGNKFLKSRVHRFGRCVGSCARVRKGGACNRKKCCKWIAPGVCMNSNKATCRLR